VGGIEKAPLVLTAVGLGPFERLFAQEITSVDGKRPFILDKGASVPSSASARRTWASKASTSTLNRPERR